MNPSTAGWINKFGQLVNSRAHGYTDFSEVYKGLKKTGFVYGINTKVPRFIETEHTLSEDEKAKINLLTALYYTYVTEVNSTDFELFLEKIFQFYKDLEINHISFFDKILTGNKTSAQLEKLIGSRIYLEDNLISKTFNNSITNSLLFIDILAFKHYLKQEKGISALSS